MDTLFDDDELITKRFSCECLSQGHIMDINIELTDGGTKLVSCTLNFLMDGKAPLKWRLKELLKLLRGEEIDILDFIIRPVDIPELIKALRQAIPITHTSGTTVI